MGTAVATQVIEQLSFEGINVQGLRASMKALTIDVWRKMAIGTKLAVTSEVVVVGVNHFRDDDNLLVRNHTLKEIRSDVGVDDGYEHRDSALNFEGLDVGSFVAAVGAHQPVPPKALRIGDKLTLVASTIVVGVSFTRDENDVLVRTHKLKVLEADLT